MEHYTIQSLSVYTSIFAELPLMIYMLKDNIPVATSQTSVIELEVIPLTAAIRTPGHIVNWLVTWQQIYWSQGVTVKDINAPIDDNS